MDWKQYFRSIPHQVAALAALVVMAQSCLGGDGGQCPDDARWFDRFCYQHCHWFWECCHGPYGNPRTHQIPYGTPCSCPPQGPLFGYYAPVWQPWPECYQEVETVTPTEEVPSEPAMPAPVLKSPQQSHRAIPRAKQAAAQPTKQLSDDWDAPKIERLPAAQLATKPAAPVANTRQVNVATKPPTAEQHVVQRRVEPRSTQTNYVSLAPPPPAVPTPKSVDTAAPVAAASAKLLRPEPPAYSTPQSSVVIKPEQQGTQTPTSTTSSERIILK